MRPAIKGRHYGPVTAKTYAILIAILWKFHNARSGLCFPSYETIAEAAGCCPRTVAAAIRMLEAVGLLTWVNRVKRVRQPICDLLGAGERWRVFRTSNAYAFRDPAAAQTRPNVDDSSKCKNCAGTKNQALDSSLLRLANVISNPFLTPIAGGQAQLSV
jgi:hypothetical protein